MLWWSATPGVAHAGEGGAVARLLDDGHRVLERRGRALGEGAGALLLRRGGRRAAGDERGGGQDEGKDLHDDPSTGAPHLAILVRPFHGRAQVRRERAHVV